MSNEQVNRKLESLNRNKAAGFDGCDLLKTYAEQLCELLLLFFNQTLT